MIILKNIPSKTPYNNILDSPKTLACIGVKGLSINWMSGVLF